MDFGKVIGTVVSTIKDPSLRGVKLLVVQPNNEKFEAAGDCVVAVDGAGVGIGEYIYYESGPEAVFALAVEKAPVDCAIVGIVDTIEADSVVRFPPEQVAGG